jgi:UDP-glucose:(heptosyl)LPS alpha-1,3-glucosyltransferase
MKIAILRKKYTFHGGAEGFSQSLITQLSGAGHEVHIYAIAWTGVLQARNVYFHKVPAVTFNSFLRDLTFALSSKRQVARDHYDVIQSHDKTLCQDVYRAGDGCHIEWLRQRWRRTGLFGRLSMFLNPYHWLILGLERSIFHKHRYRKIMAISEMVKKNIIENYGVPADDIVVIYNGVDLERFHPKNKERYRQEVRRQYGVTDTEFVTLFVGSGFERKGVKYLLDAAELLDVPVTIMIVGKGSEEKFRHGVRKQRVIFCGPQKQIERYYAAADAFVFPTIYEPFGNVHLEALASGLPVITTKNSGASEVIEQGRNGFVVKTPEDIRAIAEGMQKLLDRDLLRAMAGEARRTAEKFTFERYTGEIMGLYSGIMKEKSAFRRVAA